MGRQYPYIARLFRTPPWPRFVTTSSWRIFVCFCACFHGSNCPKSPRQGCGLAPSARDPLSTVLWSERSFLTVLYDGLTLLGFSAFYQPIVVGIVVIAAAGAPSASPERRSPTVVHRRRGTTASRPSIRVVSGIPTDQARKEDVVAMITGLHESTPQRNR